MHQNLGRAACGQARNSRPRKYQRQQDTMAMVGRYRVGGPFYGWLTWPSLSHSFHSTLHSKLLPFHIVIPLIYRSHLWFVLATAASENSFYVPFRSMPQGSRVINWLCPHDVRPGENILNGKSECPVRTMSPFVRSYGQIGPTSGKIKKSVNWETEKWLKLLLFSFVFVLVYIDLKTIWKRKASSSSSPSLRSPSEPRKTARPFEVASGL